MGTVHLITGATGFVGGAIVLELLQRTDDVILCGVRGNDAAACQQRLNESLRLAAAAYGLAHLGPEIARRCTAFPLDLEQDPRPDVVPAVARKRIFWHAAASLRYEDRHREQIFRDNIDGTRRVLGLARAVGADRFNYVSTAYVVGRRTGHLAEVIPEGEVPASNCYEVSKLAAERMVWAAPDLETRILRPSIVVGHSRTLAATSFTGLYGFVREVGLFERKVEARLGKILSMRPLSIMLTTAAPINLFPIDLVARDAVAVGLADTDRRVFHLTNDEAPRVGDTVDNLLAEIGLPRPRHVNSPRTFTTIDQTLHDHLEFYNSYINTDKTFSRDNTDAIVGAGSGRSPLSMPRVRELARWYLEHMKREACARKARNVTTQLKEAV
jgi:nucleoside-diphosphate-sugar epimerase